MMRLNARILLLLIVGQPACGRSLVELYPRPDSAIPPDAAPDGARTLPSDAHLLLPDSARSSTPDSAAVILDAKAPDDEDGPQVIPGGTIDAPPVSPFFVAATIPPNGASGEAINVVAKVAFNKAPKVETIDNGTFTLMQGGKMIAGDVIFRQNYALFDPNTPLAPDTVCIGTVKQTAASSVGETLTQDYSWTFTTGVSVKPPTVESTLPENTAINILSHRPLMAQFTKRMSALSINETTFVVRQGARQIPGLVTYSTEGWTATFNPKAPWESALPYKATITTGATDRAGVPLDNDYVWTFRTAACTQEPLKLGAAAGFAVLGGAGVTSAGATIVTGAVGAGTTVSGFPPGTINEAVSHVADGLSQMATADLTKALAAANDLTMCPNAISGNIGGKTLGPGLYRATDMISVDDADLTLDGRDDPDAVFILQIGGDLKVQMDRKVKLVGRARSGLVFWLVDGGATLGKNSLFVGTLMTNQAITLEGGASVQGRILSLKGTVTLNGNEIALPKGL